jgi:flagellin
MALNIISNYAANVAHRNLQVSDEAATRSLAKLSSGTRVVSARDDAASMAIGSRLNAESQSLKTATVNVGQANSMLQIADGAMGTVDSVLVRMKTLAVQGSSENLSATERQFAFDEFKSLGQEIDRISTSTKFNSNKLLAGSQTVSATPGSIGTDIETADGIAAITFGDQAAGVTNGDAFQLDYSTATSRFTITNTTTGESTSSDPVTAAPAAGTTQDVKFDKFDLTLSLSSAFNPATAIAANNTFTAAVTASTTTTFNFQIGTGSNTAENQIAISIDAIGTSGLSTALGTDVAGTSWANATNAATSIDNVNEAIDNLQTRRAAIGTYQNRLDFASQNLSTTQENTEAARSTLMDLDVASEMTKFSSKQVLVQSGVAMLAQANQMPQNLLRLLQ